MENYKERETLQGVFTGAVTCAIPEILFKSVALPEEKGSGLQQKSNGSLLPFSTLLVSKGDH